MSNKYNFYKDLPPWAKGVVTVGGLAIVGFIIYNAYKKVKDARDIKDANKVAEDADRELSKLRSRGVKESYSPTQYESFALKLVEAMNGCGTSNDSVTAVFDALKNKADVLALIKSFGVRFYRPCPATDPISYARYLYDDKSFGGTLQTWLEYDLSSSEIKDINKNLASKNIDFQF